MGFNVLCKQTTGLTEAIVVATDLRKCLEPDNSYSEAILLACKRAKRVQHLKGACPFSPKHQRFGAVERGTDNLTLYRRGTSALMRFHQSLKLVSLP